MCVSAAIFNTGFSSPFIPPTKTSTVFISLMAVLLLLLPYHYSEVKEEAGGGRRGGGVVLFAAADFRSELTRLNSNLVTDNVRYIVLTKPVELTDTCVVTELYVFGDNTITSNILRRPSATITATSSPLRDSTSHPLSQAWDGFASSIGNGPAIEPASPAWMEIDLGEEWPVYKVTFFTATRSGTDTCRSWKLLLLSSDRQVLYAKEQSTGDVASQTSLRAEGMDITGSRSNWYWKPHTPLADAIADCNKRGSVLGGYRDSAETVAMSHIAKVSNVFLGAWYDNNAYKWKWNDTRTDITTSALASTCATEQPVGCHWTVAIPDNNSSKAVVATSGTSSRWEMGDVANSYLCSKCGGVRRLKTHTGVVNYPGSSGASMSLKGATFSGSGAIIVDVVTLMNNVYASCREQNYVSQVLVEDCQFLGDMEFRIKGLARLTLPEFGVALAYPAIPGPADVQLNITIVRSNFTTPTVFHRVAPVNTDKSVHITIKDCRVNIPTSYQTKLVDGLHGGAVAGDDKSRYYGFLFNSCRLSLRHGRLRLLNNTISLNGRSGVSNANIAVFQYYTEVDTVEVDGNALSITAPSGCESVAFIFRSSSELRVGRLLSFRWNQFTMTSAQKKAGFMRHDSEGVVPRIGKYRNFAEAYISENNGTITSVEDGYFWDIDNYGTGTIEEKLDTGVQALNYGQFYVESNKVAVTVSAGSARVFLFGNERQVHANTSGVISLSNNRFTLSPHQVDGVHWHGFTADHGGVIHIDDNEFRGTSESGKHCKVILFHKYPCVADGLNSVWTFDRNILHCVGSADKNYHLTFDASGYYNVEAKHGGYASISGNNIEPTAGTPALGIQFVQTKIVRAFDEGVLNISHNVVKILADQTIDPHAGIAFLGSDDMDALYGGKILLDGNQVVMGTTSNDDPGYALKIGQPLKAHHGSSIYFSNNYFKIIRGSASTGSQALYVTGTLGAYNSSVLAFINNTFICETTSPGSAFGIDVTDSIVAFGSGSSVIFSGNSFQAKTFSINVGNLWSITTAGDKIIITNNTFQAPVDFYRPVVQDGAHLVFASNNAPIARMAAVSGTTAFGGKPIVRCNFVTSPTWQEVGYSDFQLLTDTTGFQECHPHAPNGVKCSAVADCSPAAANVGAWVELINTTTSSSVAPAPVCRCVCPASLPIEPHCMPIVPTNTSVTLPPATALPPVGTQAPWTFEPTPAPPPPPTPTPVTGVRYVTITGASDAAAARSINICEVQVFTPTFQNVALSKPSRMSSQYSQFPAFGAVDGNIRQDYSVSGLCAHTDSDDPAPFWEVDIGSEVDVHNIVIYNRIDDCCIDRLAYYRLVLSSASREVLRVVPLSAQGIQNYSFSPNNADLGRLGEYDRDKFVWYIHPDISVAGAIAACGDDADDGPALAEITNSSDGAQLAALISGVLNVYVGGWKAVGAPDNEILWVWNRSKTTISRGTNCVGSYCDWDSTRMRYKYNSNGRHLALMGQTPRSTHWAVTTPSGDSLVHGYICGNRSGAFRTLTRTETGPSPTATRYRRYRSFLADRSSSTQALAHEQCRRRGGWLATVPDATAQAQLVADLSGPGQILLTRRTWLFLGGSDNNTEGLWQWDYGPVSRGLFYGNGSCVRYCNWAVGEPNNGTVATPLPTTAAPGASPTSSGLQDNAGGDTGSVSRPVQPAVENCLGLNSDFTWSDVSHTSGSWRGYVCEFNEETATATHATTTHSNSAPTSSTSASAASASATAATPSPSAATPSLSTSAASDSRSVATPTVSKTSATKSADPSSTRSGETATATHISPTKTFPPPMLSPSISTPTLSKSITTYTITVHTPSASHLSRTVSSSPVVAWLLTTNGTIEIDDLLNGGSSDIRRRQLLFSIVGDGFDATGVSALVASTGTLNHRRFALQGQGATGGVEDVAYCIHFSSEIDVVNEYLDGNVTTHQLNSSAFTITFLPLAGANTSDLYRLEDDVVVTTSVDAQCLKQRLALVAMNFTMRHVAKAPAKSAEEKATAEATDVVSIATAAAGAGMVAVQVARSSIVLGLTRCQPEFNQPLGKMQHPFRFTIGPEKYGQFVAAAMLNPIIMIGFPLIHALCGVLYAKRNGKTALEGITWIRFPSVSILFPMYLIEPTAMAAMVTLTNAEELSYRVVAGFTLVICLAIPVGILVYLRKTWAATFIRGENPRLIARQNVTAVHDDDDPERQEAMWKLRLRRFVAWLNYCVDGGVKWRSYEGHEGFTRRNRLMFMDFTGHWFWWISIEIGIALICGIFDGIKLGPGKCDGIIIALVVTLAVFFIAIVKIRPYNAPFLMFFSVLVTLVQLAGASLMAVSMFGGGSGFADAATQLTMVGIWLILARGVFDIAPKVKQMIHALCMPKKKKAAVMHEDLTQRLLEVVQVEGADGGLQVQQDHAAAAAVEMEDMDRTDQQEVAAALPEWDWEDSDLAQYGAEAEDEEEVPAEIVPHNQLLFSEEDPIARTTAERSDLGENELLNRLKKRRAEAAAAHGAGVSVLDNGGCSPPPPAPTAKKPPHSSGDAALDRLLDELEDADSARRKKKRHRRHHDDDEDQCDEGDQAAGDQQMSSRARSGRDALSSMGRVVHADVSMNPAIVARLAPQDSSAAAVDVSSQPHPQLNSTSVDADLEALLDELDVPQPEEHEEMISFPLPPRPPVVDDDDLKRRLECL